MTPTNRWLQLVSKPDLSLHGVWFFQDKGAEGGSGRLPVPLWIQIMQHIRDVTRWARPHDAKSKPVDIHLAVYERCGPSLRSNQPL